MKLLINDTSYVETPTSFLFNLKITIEYIIRNNILNIQQNKYLIRGQAIKYVIRDDVLGISLR